ncbi:MAG: DUF2279 domain-containing protein [Arcobacteraceae bacterium]|nr:DUF2279 domain-containing protein [Arcobacteraceae bacterium]
MKRLLLIFILFLETVYSDDQNLTLKRSDHNFSKEQKAIILNSATSLGLITWGILHWDYSLTNKMHSQSEGWFEKDTKSGGADKLGHAYAGYGMTHLFAHYYKEFGYKSDNVALYGALSSLGFTTLMEIGDAFSPYGLSHEDAISNIIGVGFGYLSYKYPSIDDKVDFRLEYKINKNSLKGDAVTDYENMKHLLAFKASGFDIFKNNSYLKYLELHVGYYSRGYDNINDEKQRNTYIGLGINFSKLFNTKIFKYYQIPDSYLKSK